MTLKKKNPDLNRQIETSVSKHQKHDANLQKNTSLYFQIGLILCLLLTYSLFEMSFEKKEIIVSNYPELQEDDMYVYNTPIKVFKEEVKQKKKKPIVFTNPVVADNDDPQIETKDIFEEPTIDGPPVDPREIHVKEIPEELPPLNIMAVEQVPIFPGCETAKNNNDRRQCMSDKIAAHIQKKFDTDIAVDMGLKGEQKIYVMFKIDKQGQVVDVKTNSKYKQLDEEATRVISKLPIMTPGRQKDKHVDVLYGIPIKFNILN